MQINVSNGHLILSNPESLSERVLLETIHTLASQVGNKIEFEVASSSTTGHASHVSMKPYIPDEYKVDESTGEVEMSWLSKGCHICGGLDH